MKTPQFIRAVFDLHKITDAVIERPEPKTLIEKLEGLRDLSPIIAEPHVTKAIDIVKQHSDWVAVSENQLPPPKTQLIICFGDYMVFGEFRDTGDKKLFDTGDSQPFITLFEEATAWMIAPKSYQTPQPLQGEL